MTIGIEPEVEVPIIEIPSAPTIEAEELEDEYGRFVAERLDRGFGATLGNALRRVLLNSLLGSAINAVRIEGVQHEYSTMKDVREDVTEIMLNIKGVRLRGHSDRPGTLRLEVQGPGQVTAGDIQPSADYDIVNPEAYIASLDSAHAELAMELYVGQGTGYQPATPVEGDPIGVLPVDAIYTPIRRVNYHVDKTRIGQITDFEKLTIEIWTDGSIGPKDAMKEAAKTLVGAFDMIAKLDDVQDPDTDDPNTQIPPAIYDMTIEKLELSARTLNCLKRSKINKVGEILLKTQDELLRIKNFGEKSLVELNERLVELGIVSPDDIEELPSEDAEDLAADVSMLPRSFGPDDEPPAHEPMPEADDQANESADTTPGGEPIKDLSALRALLGEDGEGDASENKTE